MKKILFKIVRIVGIFIIAMLLLMLLLPVLFPGFVAGKIKLWANDDITTELNFSKARLSFFNHFPALTLTLHDVTLMGSPPYSKDTLLKADELAFGINLPSLLSKKVNIDEIYLDNADIDVKVNAAGEANYNVYRSVKKTTTVPGDTAGTSLKIRKIQISNSNLMYKDLSIPMLIRARNLNYTGGGDLDKAVFDLASSINIDSFDLAYNGTQYVQSKKLQGKLITRLNTHSLAIDFEENDLLINSLPVKFTGNFEFLPNGYGMNLDVSSHNGNLQQVLSALPPQYAGWLAKSQTDGQTDIDAFIKGKYIVKENMMPDLGFTLKIRDGSVRNKQFPTPVKNLFLNLDAKLPSLDTDSLYVSIDSLFFNVGNDYFSGLIKLNDLNLPTIHARINTEMDLEKWNKAMGIAPFEVKGKFSLHLTVDGSYKTSVVRKGIRARDTVVSSIPSFRLVSSLSNGYFKLTSLPKAVQNINFEIDAINRDGIYQHSDIAIQNFNAHMLNDYVQGSLRLSHLMTVDATLQSVIHLENIKQYYPMDSLQLAGDLTVRVTSKGDYQPKDHQFPVTDAHLTLQNGRLQTAYFPDPVEKIQMVLDAVNHQGTLNDMQLDVKPVSFEFEGQPFKLQANLQNFANLKYDITSTGTLDIGKLYQVFAQKGLNIKGLIKTNLILRGLQSDARAHQFGRLYNSGTAEVNNIYLVSDYFPLPFFIKTGVFRFDQDKMWFTKFVGTYGKTDMTLNGYLSNIIDYAMKPDAPLNGQFDLSADHLFVDEFMAFAGDTTAASTSSGVVMIPSNLNLNLNATVNKVTYQGMDLNDFKGGVALNNGTLTLHKTSFAVIGAPVDMDATYSSVSATKANFTYNIDAQNFDIRKAYNEIKIFHDLATSAASLQGVVSLQYRMAGKLDSNMHPVYPSLKGNGVLSLQEVKLKGYKLLGAVSKATNRDSLNNPTLKKIDIKTTIANNVITLQKTKMRIFGFRPHFEGQVSFDGKLNISGRIGLPPLGIIGIPFTVTGTQDKPIVKLKREKDSDKLLETEDGSNDQ